MFEQRQTPNMVSAGLTTLGLIYHMTVYKLRVTDRNAVAGLLMTIARSLLMVAFFFVFFYVLKVRSSPIQGNFIVYIMTGIFMFLTHNQAIRAVMAAEGAVSPLMKHTPMNTAITISASALAVLYQQILASMVLLIFTDKFIEPLDIDRIYPCIGMLVLAWLSGCCIGLVFRAAEPWWPRGVNMLVMVYTRLNMVSSGKMFVANTLPTAMLIMFDWNPLF
ncbi:MAG: ABC transporter, partial [Paracoccus sp. (in: a-proteobacteria)]|nr:ABC transporter [Paracoccus sp. (in: a-proteobacteria)]